MQGAETLLGDGDMLYMAPDSGYPVRVQGCYVSPEELDRVIGFWRKEFGPVDDRSPWKRMAPPEEPEGPGASHLDAGLGGANPPVDEQMLQRAISVVKTRGSASTSLLQRRLHIGYPRAARLMEVLTEMGVVGPPVAGGQRRDVLIGGEGEDKG
jgi:S-DNA-T family DNA segregation ATPase FtsK/SpoIIIE